MTRGPLRDPAARGADVILLPVQVDDITSALRTFPCDLPATAPIALLLPGLGFRAAWYDRIGPGLADRGLRLVTAEWRGADSSSVRPSRAQDWGYATLVEQDIPAQVARVRAEWPEARIVILGHSLGGQLGLHFAAANPGAVAAVVTVAACSVYWPTFPPAARYRVALGVHLIPVIAALLGWFPGKRLGFAGDEARTIMRDWAHQGRTGRYAPKGAGWDYERRLAELEEPALLLSLADDLFAPAASVEHLRAKLPPGVPHVHLTDDQVRDRHMSWVRSADPILDAVGTFVQGLQAPGG